MGRKTFLAIILILSACLLDSCRTSQTPRSATGTSDASAETRPCVANITVEGSRLTSRTFRTYQDFSDVTRAAAFDQIVKSLATLGFTISSSSKETGVITSWSQPDYSKGQTESLNVVVRDKGGAGIRVEVTYIAPAMATVPKSRLHNGFCKIMSDVESAKKSFTKPQAKPTKTSEGDLRKTEVIVPSENLRNEPRGKIIGKVKKGTSLIILEEQDKWLHIRLEDGTEAWIWKKSTSESPPAPSLPKTQQPTEKPSPI